MKTYETMRDEYGTEFKRDVYSALDVAKWVLHEAKRRKVAITHMRLQKYLFYIQAYGSLKIGYCEAIPLFREEIYADLFGPVVHEVYAEYCKYKAEPIMDAETEPAPKNELRWVKIPFDIRGHLTDDELRDTVRNESMWSGVTIGKPIDVGGISEVANEPWALEEYSENKKMMPLTEAEYYQHYNEDGSCIY